MQFERSLFAGSLAALFTTLASATSAEAATTQTYRFRNTLASDEVPAGNVLTDAFNGATAGVAPSFVDTVIDPNACGNSPTVRGYSFPEFGGLLSPNSAPAVIGESYTISMIVKFSPLRTGYTRLIDFSNSTLDDGIYVKDGSVSFYPVGVFADGSFADNRFSVMTITRDAATNTVSLFIGLSPAGTYVDVDKKYVPSASNMYFFMDNTTGSANISESSPGIVTFLRVSDQPIVPTDLPSIVDEACVSVACGNHLLEGAEACDDGNNVDGDGCSKTCKVENGLACGARPDAGAPITDAGADAGHAFTPGDNCQSTACDSRDSKCGWDNGGDSTCDAATAATVCRSKACGAVSKKCIPSGGCFVAGDCASTTMSCNATSFACVAEAGTDAGGSSPVTTPDASTPGAGTDAGPLVAPPAPPADEACSCGLGPRATSLPALGASFLVAAAAIARARLRRRRARR